MNAQSIKIMAVDLWRNSRAALRNLRGRLRPPEVDYIVLTLAGALPEYIPPPPAWQKWLPLQLPKKPSGASLSHLRNIFEQVALEPRLKGVVLQLNGLDVGWATAQSLRDAMSRLRAKGKQVVVYSAHYDVIHYYVATAAEKILAPRPAVWDVAGLRAELTFLKDTFAAWGVEAEAVNVSPYKTAWDTYTRSEISPEHRAMLEWIIDGRFETLVNAIAAARSLEPAAVRELIDRAPLTAETARASGLIDAVLYEDEIAAYLAPKEAPKSKAQFKWLAFGRKKEAKEKTLAPPKAALKRWSAAAPALRQPIRWRSGKRIAIIPLEGMILPGRTPQVPPLPPLPIPLPFIGEPIAGAETLTQFFREVEKDDATAAIVFYVNSRGGSALASDLIWREVDRVRRKKPVVVCMGDCAASGGYFVSAPAQHIIAQPLTLTGSIGVIALKLITAGLYEKFKANRMVIQRGANAGLYADDAPFTPEMRAVAQAQTEAYYADFKKVVMAGRKLDEPALDAVAGGRVWLGQQALGHKLVDQLGDLEAAVEKAKQLAQLPADKWTPTAWYSGLGGNLLPQPFSPSAIADTLSLLRAILSERLWMIDPFDID